VTLAPEPVDGVTLVLRDPAPPEPVFPEMLFR
jgi:hypothetical protein